MVIKSVVLKLKDLIIRESINLKSNINYRLKTMLDQNIMVFKAERKLSA